jgi:hypothetical protein
VTGRADHLFDLLELIATLGMTWWVSATVLCASIIWGVWTKRGDLRGFRAGARHGFFALVLSFLLSVMVFGVVLISITNGLGTELERVCTIDVSSGGCGSNDASSLKVAMVWGFAIGTSSFLVTTIAWIGVWFEISRTAKPKGGKSKRRVAAPAL